MKRVARHFLQTEFSTSKWNVSMVKTLWELSKNSQNSSEKSFLGFLEEVFDFERNTKSDLLSDYWFFWPSNANRIWNLFAGKSSCKVTCQMVFMGETKDNSTNKSRKNTKWGSSFQELFISFINRFSREEIRHCINICAV